MTLLIETYNCPPWNEQWTKEKGLEYIKELYSYPRFTGFLMEQDEEVVAAVIGHQKTWWKQDEVVVEELFISPRYQGQGHGKTLLQQVEDFCKEQGLLGIILLTNRKMPANHFYHKMGFTTEEDIIFKYKEVQ